MIKQTAEQMKITPWPSPQNAPCIDIDLSITNLPFVSVAAWCLTRGEFLIISTQSALMAKELLKFNPLLTQIKPLLFGRFNIYRLSEGAMYIRSGNYFR